MNECVLYNAQKSVIEEVKQELLKKSRNRKTEKCYQRSMQSRG